MKYFQWSLFMFMVIGISSCSKDKEMVEPSMDLLKNITNGTWVVTLYVDENSDEQINFEGYEMTFNSRGMVEAIKQGLRSEGTWQTIASNNRVQFNMRFTPGDVLEGLCIQWIIESQNAERISLRALTSNEDELHRLVLSRN